MITMMACIFCTLTTPVYANEPCPGDINCDGVVDGLDVSGLADDFGNTNCAVRAGRMVGEIIMWNGQVDPNGNPIINDDTQETDTRWHVCDGTMGTPDLEDRFIKGAISNNDLGEVGGSDSVTLSVQNLPPHSHNAGNLVNTNEGNHKHEVPLQFFNTVYTEVGNIGGQSVIWYLDWQWIDLVAKTAGDHTHAINGNTGNTGLSLPFDNQPPYYKLIYLMYIGEPVP